MYKIVTIIKVKRVAEKTCI